MTKRSMTWRGASWRRGAARGLLALAVLGLGTPMNVQPGTWTPTTRVALAEELDCVDDKDNYDLPECVQQREAAQREAEAAQREAEAAQRAQESQQAANDQAVADQANQPPPGPPSNPHDIVFSIEDAGKEATQYLKEEGSDKYGPWVRTRFERERTKAASTLGPNVMDTRAWVTKDVETAKALFKEQAGVNNFPERKEPVAGPNEKVKPVKAGEEQAVATQYYQDDDGKIWLHFRIVMRDGKNVGVIYLFGRQDFFADEDRKWNGQGDWYITEFANRL